MDQAGGERHFEHPSFVRLAQLSKRTRYIFSGYVFFFYMAYVLGMSFAGDFMARPLYGGAHVTIGIAFAAFVVINGVISTGLYVWWTNRYLDRLQQHFFDEIGHEKNN